MEPPQGKSFTLLHASGARRTASHLKWITWESLRLPGAGPNIDRVEVVPADEKDMWDGVCENWAKASSELAGQSSTKILDRGSCALQYLKQLGSGSGLSWGYLASGKVWYFGQKSAFPVNNLDGTIPTEHLQPLNIPYEAVDASPSRPARANHALLLALAQRPLSSRLWTALAKYLARHADHSEAVKNWPREVVDTRTSPRNPHRIFLAFLVAFCVTIFWSVMFVITVSM